MAIDISFSGTTSTAIGDLLPLPVLHGERVGVSGSRCTGVCNLSAKVALGASPRTVLAGAYRDAAPHPSPLPVKDGERGLYGIGVGTVVNV